MCVKQPKGLERDRNASLTRTILSPRVDPYPIDLPGDPETVWLLPDAADADDSIVVVVSDTSHAIIDSKMATRVRIPDVRSLVDKDAHFLLRKWNKLTAQQHTICISDMWRPSTLKGDFHDLDWHSTKRLNVSSAQEDNHQFDDANNVPKSL